MESLEILRSRLIEKIFSTNNSNLLKAIDDLLISVHTNENQNYIFSDAQIEMLKIAEEDIQYGRVITDEELRKLDEEWMK